MKNLLFIIFGIITILGFTACDDEELNANSADTFIGLDNILLQNIPDHLQAGNKLVYRSQFGEKLVVSLGLRIDTFKLTNPSSIEFEFEQIAINGTDLANDNLVFSIIGAGHLNQNNEVERSIFAEVYHNSNQFNATGVSLHEDNSITADGLSDFCGQVNLNDRTFNDVYKEGRIGVINADSLTGQIYYDPEIGVAGWERPSGKIWSFERVEE